MAGYFFSHFYFFLILHKAPISHGLALYFFHKYAIRRNLCRAERSIPVNFCFQGFKRSSYDNWQKPGGGAALRGGFLFRRWKRNQKIAGDNAENTPVFSMAFSPDPLFTGAVGGGWGFLWAAKIDKLTATRHPGQKSGPFYGGYMIRPPGSCKKRNRSVFRCVARRHRPVC